MWQTGVSPGRRMRFAFQESQFVTHAPLRAHTTASTSSIPNFYIGDQGSKRAPLDRANEKLTAEIRQLLFLDLHWRRHQGRCSGLVVIWTRLPTLFLMSSSLLPSRLVKRKPTPNLVIDSLTSSRVADRVHSHRTLLTSAISSPTSTRVVVRPPLTIFPVCLDCYRVTSYKRFSTAVPIRASPRCEESHLQHASCERPSEFSFTGR